MEWDRDPVSDSKSLCASLTHNMRGECKPASHETWTPTALRKDRVLGGDAIIVTGSGKA